MHVLGCRRGAIDDVRLPYSVHTTFVRSTAQVLAGDIRLCMGENYRRMPLLSVNGARGMMPTEWSMN